MPLWPLRAWNGFGACTLKPAKSASLRVTAVGWRTLAVAAIRAAWCGVVVVERNRHRCPRTETGGARVREG
jgi:hypothetical protein